MLGLIFTTNQSAMSLIYLGIKTEYTARGVVRLVNIFNFLAYDGRSKMNERLHGMTSNGMLLDVTSVSSK